MKKLFTIFFMLFLCTTFYAEPNYSFFNEKWNVVHLKKSTIRNCLEISRNGGRWMLELPTIEELKNYDFDENDIKENKDGFELHFNWGGGNYIHHDIFFFKEFDDEPCLYKTESNWTENSWDDKLNDWKVIEISETSEINPPVKISRLGIKKILSLLGSGYDSWPKITCLDSDYDKPIKDKTMHIEVSYDWGEGKRIHHLEYVYGENPHGMFGLAERFEPADLGIEKKHFDLVDLNFDGFDDILIFAGYTMNGSQPYYDAYLWNQRTDRFELNPPYWNEICRTYVKCNEIDRLLYSSYNTTRGLIIYYIYEYDEAREKYITSEKLYYNYKLDLYSENEKYSDWYTEWDFNDTDIVPYEKLPKYWKRAINFKGWDF